MQGTLPGTHGAGDENGGSLSMAASSALAPTLGGSCGSRDAWGGMESARRPVDYHARPGHAVAMHSCLRSAKGNIEARELGRRKDYMRLLTEGELRHPCVQHTPFVLKQNKAFATTVSAGEAGT